MEINKRIDLSKIFYYDNYRYVAKIGKYLIKLISQKIFVDGASYDNNNYRKNIYTIDGFEAVISCNGDILSHENYKRLDINIEKNYYNNIEPPDYNPDRLTPYQIEDIVEKLMIAEGLINKYTAICHNCGGNNINGNELCWACEKGI